MTEATLGDWDTEEKRAFLPLPVVRTVPILGLVRVAPLAFPETPGQQLS